MLKEAGEEIPRFCAQLEVFGIVLVDGRRYSEIGLYRAICFSRSSIFARLEMFLGFGLGA